MRRIWTIVALLLVLALLLGGVALSSERFLLAALHWGMAEFTDLTLELEDPHIDALAGELSAAQIHLVPRGTAGPALVSVLGFSASTQLGDILRGNLLHTSIRADGLIIYVSENDLTEDPSPMEWLQYLSWLPHDLKLEQVHVVTAAEKTLIFPVKALRGDRVEPKRYVATAVADYQGEPLNLALELRATAESRELSSVQMSAEVLAPVSGSEFRLEGELQGTLEQFQYDFTLDGSYLDIAEFLAGFENAVPIHGSLKVNARMQGDAEGFVLSDAVFVLDNMPDYGFEAGGRLEYKLSGENRIELVAAGEMASLDYLLEWLNLDLASLGRAQASLSLTGSLEKPFIDRFVLQTQHSEGLTVNLSGSSHLPGTQPGGTTEVANEIRFDAYGPSLSVLESWFGAFPVETGTWRTSGRLTGDINALAAEDLLFETGNRDSVELRVLGRIGSISKVDGTGLAALQGVDLTFLGHTPDTAHLAALLDADIPPAHEASAQIRMTGSGMELRATEGNITVAAAGTQVKLVITDGALYPGTEHLLRDVRGDLSLVFDDTGRLSAYTGGGKIPSLGPVAVTAKLLQRDGRLQLERISGGVKPADGGPEISTSGRVADLGNFSGLSLATRFTGIETRDLLTGLNDNFRYGKPLGHVQGKLTLTRQQNQWDISGLELHTADDKGPLVLSASGNLSDITNFPATDMVSEYRVRDPALMEAIIGVPLNPLTGRITTRTTPGEIFLSNQMQIGRNRLDLNGVIAYSNEKIDNIRAVFSTPHLYLADLGMQLGQPEAGQPVSERPETGGPLQKLLETPPPYQTDINVNIARITGSNNEIQGMNVHLTGENNRYTLRQFSLAYAHTTAELRGIIDLNQMPPAVSIGGEAIAIPLLALSNDLGIESDISGIITLRGGVSASGMSSQALLSTLTGSMAIALEDAVIKGAAYDVLATDLLEWIYSGALLDSSTKVDCTMAQFILDNGVALTDSLYIETPKMVATGKAKFDLVRKRMDMTVTPMSKSRALQVPSSVRVKGDISSPTSVISPVTAVMDASAQALTLVPRLTLKLFGLDKSSNKQRKPCEPG